MKCHRHLQWRSCRILHRMSPRPFRIGQQQHDIDLGWCRPHREHQLPISAPHLCFTMNTEVDLQEKKRSWFVGRYVPSASLVWIDFNQHFRCKSAKHLNRLMPILEVVRNDGLSQCSWQVRPPVAQVFICDQKLLADIKADITKQISIEWTRKRPAPLLP